MNDLGFVSAFSWTAFLGFQVSVPALRLQQLLEQIAGVKVLGSFSRVGVCNLPVPQLPGD